MAPRSLEGRYVFNEGHWLNRVVICPADMKACSPLPGLFPGGGRLGRAPADAVRPEAQPAAPRLAGGAQAGGFVRQVRECGKYMQYGGVLLKRSPSQKVVGIQHIIRAHFKGFLSSPPALAHEL